MSRLVERGLRREISLGGGDVDSRLERVRLWLVREGIPVIGEIRKILNAHVGNFVEVDSELTITTPDRIFLVDTSSGPFDIFLPSADGNMRELIFKRKPGSSNFVRIKPATGDEIDGNPSAVILITSTNTLRRFVSVDTGWISV